jgi:hypothetical protein
LLNSNKKKGESFTSCKPPENRKLSESNKGIEGHSRETFKQMSSSSISEVVARVMPVLIPTFNLASLLI